MEFRNEEGTGVQTNNMRQGAAVRAIIRSGERRSRESGP